MVTFQMGKRNSIIFLITIIFAWSPVAGQISPGKLAKVHSHLEGLSNCTKCHTLGAKISNEKCFACHTDIKVRIDQNKGFHASAGVHGKPCFTCHSDHHGENFQIIRFDKEKFNHNLAGFRLSGTHAKQPCSACHKQEFISERTIKNKKFTYLGLNQNCQTCHADVHQNTLPPPCSRCHGYESFKPAVQFSHSIAKFQLEGQHKNVPCIKCHKIIVRDGKNFQEFTGMPFKSCVNCHIDPHHNQFGQNCAQCHNAESFHTVKGIANFDHSKTGFKLEDKHQSVPCASCHKTNLTDPLRHDRCTNCHKDYHQGQFTNRGMIADCSGCHTTKGFAGSSFTIEQHNAGPFKLEGAHLATACIACHKKQDQWSFRNIGTRCVDCHENIHETFISQKFYPESGCQHCHNESGWTSIRFDHSLTGFDLKGAHAQQTCRTCHFRKDDAGREYQKFADLPSTCTSCHQDIHYGQFENKGASDCLRCHQPESWKISNFDHNKTAFKLDGKHEKVPCAKCHKTISENQKSFVLFKIKDTRCEHCH